MTFLSVLGLPLCRMESQSGGEEGPPLFTPNEELVTTLMSLGFTRNATIKVQCCHCVISCCVRLVYFKSVRGRNSSVGSAWARCPQCHGFDPPQGTFSGRGDFSLVVNMGSNSIPPKTPSDESINRGLVCAHMHFIARTQKILTFMS